MLSEPTKPFPNAYRTITSKKLISQIELDTAASLSDELGLRLLEFTSSKCPLSSINFMPSNAHVPIVKSILEDCTTLPPGITFANIKRGQSIMQQHAIPALLFGLLHYSLIGGVSSPIVNRTLISTGLLSGGKIRALKRLLRTLLWVLQIWTPESLLPGSHGWRSTLSVRLMHARARRITGGVNVKELIATQCAFMAIYFDFLPTTLGIQLSESEIDEVLAVWAWIGKLLGIPDKYNAALGGTANARSWAESIWCDLAHPDESSVKLAGSLIDSVSHSRISRELHVAIVRRVHNDHFTRDIGLTECSIWARVIVDIAMWVVWLCWKIEPTWLGKRRGNWIVKRFHGHLSVILEKDSKDFWIGNDWDEFSEKFKHR